MGEFKIRSEYTPGGDQPQAIEKLVKGLEAGNRFQTLLGATGTGKFSASRISAYQSRPRSMN